MDDRSRSFSRCAQVRTKVHIKDYGWSVGLVYDFKGLPKVTTARSRMAEVLQMVSELILMVSQTRMCQLKRIRWRTGQRRGHVCMTRGSSGRDTVWYVCC
jgi:hypothetical protein